MNWQRVAWRGLATSLISLLPGIASIGLLPTVLADAGADRLGTYQFIVGWASLFAFLDLNLGQAMTRQIVVGLEPPGVAAARASRSGLAMLVAISGTAITIAFGLSGLSVVAKQLSVTGLASACLIWVALILASGLAGIANAVHKLVVVALANSINVVCTYGGFALIRWTTNSSDAMLLWSAGVSLASLGIALAFVVRTVPAQWLVPKWTTDAALDLLRFALPSWWGRVANLAITVGDRLIVGVLLGVAAVPLYYLPTLLMRYLVSGMGVVSLVAFPAIVEHWKEQPEHERVNSYVRGTELFLLVAAGPPLIAALWAEPVIGVWLSRKYVEPSAQILVWASIAAVPTLASMMPFCVADAAGRPQFGAVGRTIQALAIVGLSIPLARAEGAIGVAMAYAVGSFALWAYGAAVVERRLLRRPAYLLSMSALVRPAAIGLAVATVASVAKVAAPSTGFAVLVGVGLSAAAWAIAAVGLLIAKGAGGAKLQPILGIHLRN